MPPAPKTNEHCDQLKFFGAWLYMVQFAQSLERTDAETDVSATQDPNQAIQFP